MKNLALLAFMGALCTISGCSKGSRHSPTSASPTSLSPGTVMAQSTAVEPKVATVETQPTMFEWRGVYDGLSLAEFQAKHGKNCGESSSGSYGCVTSMGGDNSVVALYFRGQVYSFSASCQIEAIQEQFRTEPHCRPLLAALMGHFGTPTYDSVKFGESAIGWESSLELAQYVPPSENNASGAGTLTVCGPDFSPSGQCHPDF